ncbi:MAG: NAD(P)/FAD-dependent oxidoreductase [Candidatus Omnitrophota bacterium]
MSHKSMYDVAIIGSGSAGIACAKEAIKNNLTVVLLEKDISLFGGTCLNKGCIPTKSLINSVKLNYSWNEAFKRKEDIVKSIRDSALFDFKKKGVTVALGQVSFTDNHTLKIDGKKISARNIVIAAGSAPVALVGHPQALPAQDFLGYSTIKDKFLIIGAGYIGVEFASILKGYGKSVILIEQKDRILPSFDSSLSKRLEIILKKKGIAIETKKDYSDYDFNKFDKVIVACGRKPNLNDLNVSDLGIALDEAGWIITDKQMRTNVEGVYACGDTTGKIQLASVAQYQGRLCIANIRGSNEEEDYRAVPECVFSLPQAACVGLLEEEAKKRNIEHTVLRSNFLTYSSSYVYGDHDGFIQLIVGQDDRIIGSGIISNHAAELINFFSLAISSNLRLEDLKKCVFIHPTLSEIIPLFSGQN